MKAKIIKVILPSINVGAVTINLPAEYKFLKLRMRNNQITLYYVVPIFNKLPALHPIQLLLVETDEGFEYSYNDEHLGVVYTLEGKEIHVFDITDRE
jgi:hypothetical protein